MRFAPIYKTSLPLPIYQIQAEVSWSHSFRLSGRETLCLLVADSFQKSPLSLGQALMRFGIPESVLPLFYESLRVFILQGLVAVKGGGKLSTLADFQKAAAADLCLTQSGKDALKNKKKPTVENEKKAMFPLYYDPLTKELTMRPAPEAVAGLLPADLKAPAIDANEISALFESYKGREDFPVGEDDSISQVRIEGVSCWGGLPCPAQIEIHGEKLSFTFSEPKAQTIWEELNDPRMLESVFHPSKKLDTVSPLKDTDPSRVYGYKRVLTLTEPPKDSFFLTAKPDTIYSYPAIFVNKVIPFPYSESIRIASGRLTQTAPCQYRFITPYGPMSLPLTLEYPMSEQNVGALVNSAIEKTDHLPDSPYVKAAVLAAADTLSDSETVGRCFDAILKEASGVEIQRVLAELVKDKRVRLSLEAKECVSRYSLVALRRLISENGSLPSLDIIDYIKTLRTDKAYGVDDSKLIAVLSELVGSGKKTEAFDRICRLGFDFSQVVRRIDPVSEIWEGFDKELPLTEETDRIGTDALRQFVLAASLIYRFTKEREKAKTPEEIEKLRSRRDDYIGVQLYDITCLQTDSNKDTVNTIVACLNSMRNFFGRD